MACRVSAGRALLTALAGLTAYESGALPAEDVMAMSDDAGEPGEAFVAALAVAAKLAEEVRRLGGDPDVLRGRIYARASELAYS